MTTISDPHKETILFIDLSGNRCQMKVRKVISCDAIIALEKRLQAAEKMAEAALRLISTGSGSSDLMEAVTAYREVSQ